MHFETLKSRKKKYFLYALVVGVALLLPLVLTFSKAKYKMTESINIVEGTIKNYSPADLSLLAIKLQNAKGAYESNNTIPESGYKLNETESYCTILDESRNNVKDSSITINYHDGVVGFDNMKTKGTKCYLYFDKTTMTIQDILANMSTITTRNSFSSTYTSTTTGTIFTAEDDYGTSYYYSGNPTDNWVKFAGFYWRIIRINGDGSIRIIYQGTSANATGEGTQVGTSKFNSSYDNNMYVGYMYTSDQVHGLGTSSTIKGELDTWYNNNLSGYESYLDTNAGYCNDRYPSTSSSSSNGSGGTGTTVTYYAAYIRLIRTKSPSLKCKISSDLFTISSSNNGNKALTKPIGLITADEGIYAGGVYGTNNSSYYLNTGQVYWTMTPTMYASTGLAGMISLNNAGGYGNSGVTQKYGVRPVINLRADTTFIYGATGTAENPYVVQ